MTNRCSIPGCRGEVEIVYLGHGVCQPHWDRFTAEDQPAEALARALGIQVAGATVTEAEMTENTNAAPSAATEGSMAENKTQTKTARKKAAKMARAAKRKREKPSKQRPPKEDLVVFACRVAEAERVKFHEATGPAGASRFARRLMVVFANEDEAGFRALLREARELRA